MSSGSVLFRETRIFSSFVFMDWSSEGFGNGAESLDSRFLLCLLFTLAWIRFSSIWISIPGPVINISDFTDSELTAAFSMVWQERGQHLMTFTFPSSRITSQTWGYNLSSGEWFEFVSDGAAYRAKSTVKIYDKFIVGDDGSQCGYLDNDTHTDYGDTILREKASQPFILEEGEEYIVKSIEAWLESGTGLTSGQGSDPEVFMDFSDDLGRTWSPEDWRKLGKKGVYGQRTEWRRQGLVRRDRVYRFKASDPAKFNLMKLTATL